MKKTFNIKLNHEGASSFPSDSSEIFFTRCGDEDKIGIDYCELYYSKRNSDGTFEEPQLMNLFRDTAKFNVGQPSLSSDGYKLYFSLQVFLIKDTVVKIFMCVKESMINGQFLKT